MKFLKELLFLFVLFSTGIVFGQTITGIVSNDGLPLPGVNVQIKGTDKGTTTDFDGVYSISDVGDNAILIFSSIGFVTTEVAVSGQTKIDINLEEDIESLNEVIVIAYGTTTKKDLTGAVATVSPEELNSFPATNVDQALQGKTAGVQITANSGQPGAQASVNIRGVGTFTDTNPLYVVDGYPTEDISFVNPNNIEAVSVLKDASASALYGIRASNGVVIITTKKGKSGKVQADVNSFVGIRSQPESIDVLGFQDFIGFANGLSASSNAQVAGSAVPYAGWTDPATLAKLSNVDWQDSVFREAFFKSTSFNIRGGNENIKSAFSAGVYDEDGTLLGSEFRRYNAGLNSQIKLNDKLKVNVNVNYSTSKSIQPLGTGRDGLLNLYSNIPHLAPEGEVNLRGENNVTNQPQGNGGFGAYPDIGGEGFRDSRNFVARALENDADNSNSTLLGNFDINWDIYGGLSTQIKIGTRLNNNASSFFQPKYYRSNGNIDLRDNATFKSEQATSNEWLAEYLLKYNKNFAEKHTIDVLGGVSAQREIIRSTSITGSGFLSNDIRSIAAADNVINSSGGAVSRTIAGIFGRVNYNYDRKYYATATIRRDGVGNRFSEENLWDIFPSVALAWNISEESFMEDTTFNLLKLRASWGESGAFRGAQNFGFLSTFGSGTPQLDSNTVLGAGLVPTRLANPDLRWETQVQTDIGIEGELLNNKVYFTADYFNKTSDGLLFTDNVPIQTGFPNKVVNGGTIENKGFELLLGYKDKKGDFGWDINANVSFIDSEITEIDNPSGSTTFTSQFLDSFNENGFWYDITRASVGDKPGSFYGFVADGIFTEETLQEANDLAVANGEAFYQDQNTSAGDRRFKDLNGDGKVDADDRQTIGSSTPDFYGSINLNLNYKNFDLGLNFYGSYGNEVFNLVKRELESASGYGNSASFSNVSQEYFNNRWTQDNPSNTYARALIDDGGIQNNRASSYFIEDGSFFRLRNVKIGYTLPKSLVDKVGLERVKVYASAQNVFTITDYTGSDPEIGQNSDIDGVSNATTRGIDAGAYPLSKSFTFGLNLNF